MHEHLEHPLPAALTPYVRGIQGYRITGCAPGTHIGLPSADVTCVFDLGAGLDLSGLGLSGMHHFQASFSGLHTSPATIHHDGSQHGIMLYLTPPGLHELFGIPAAELVGSAVDLTDLLGHLGTDLTERVRRAPGWSCLDVLCQILLARLPEQPSDDVAGQVWRRLARADGLVSVRSLADESGWSVRYLRSRFTTEFGVAPKTVCRLMRFERSVEAVRGCTTLSRAAYLTGYADQAHLAREWREFAGVAPSRWLVRGGFAPAE
ncbi:helix-turn-helix domain-containing protein [Leekyejoonella antrihumi]|uniref:Helix-turn-helix transcriptional regulator n=1 Tax=Leekyejoonella antrihumi TaxID=1660198 RepID=A0A563E902_9MICO|nr:AraC family transcriptional regulator [Leekyejoonella antrihumi]TWP38977.1 helix-turn-helix transcriptional regulator [Leekyejoonella antrihumi]